VEARAQNAEKRKPAILQKKSCQLTSFSYGLSILERQQNNRKGTILKNWWA
jgi:hypothetical protein